MVRRKRIALRITCISRSPVDASKEGLVPLDREASAECGVRKRPVGSVGRDRIRLSLLQKTRSAAGATDRRAIDGAGLRFCSTSKDYIVGPMMELGLPFHLSVEIDGLYRPLNFTSAAVNPDG